MGCDAEKAVLCCAGLFRGAVLSRCRALAGHLEALEALLGGGACAHLRNAKGWAPVHSAAGGGHLEAVLRLVAAGAQTRARPDLDVLRMLTRKTTYRCADA
jgi:ankyrin repeat protein